METKLSRDGRKNLEISHKCNAFVTGHGDNCGPLLLYTAIDKVGRRGGKTRELSLFA
jgi:hypothetical protein